MHTVQTSNDCLLTKIYNNISKHQTLHGICSVMTASRARANWNLSNNTTISLCEHMNSHRYGIIHKNIHKDEYFDTNEIQWDKDEKNGVMSNANQALSHNVFERDKILFESKYGKDLKIIRKTYIINGLRYILSGGLNFKQLFPSFLILILFVLEFFFTPLAKYWTPFQMIVIKKIT